MLIAGPGVRVGPFAHIGSNVDVAPTLLDLAGLPASPHMDGASVAPLLVDPSDAATPRATAARLLAAPRRALGNMVEAGSRAASVWRDVHFVEYYSLGNVPQLPIERGL